MSAICERNNAGRHTPRSINPFHLQRRTAVIDISVRWKSRSGLLVKLCMHVHCLNFMEKEKYTFSASDIAAVDRVSDTTTLPVVTVRLWETVILCTSF